MYHIRLRVYVCVGIVLSKAVGIVLSKIRQCCFPPPPPINLTDGKGRHLLYLTVVQMQVLFPCSRQQSGKAQLSGWCHWDMVMTAPSRKSPSSPPPQSSSRGSSFEPPSQSSLEALV